MNEEFAKMKRVLDQRPTTGKGFGWGVLGALHMNTHKLLENVLLEAELYLGLALTFGGRSAAFAEQNLEGCYAKRQLEAAKFIWFEGLEKAVRGIDRRIASQTGAAGGDANGQSRFDDSDELLTEAEALFCARCSEEEWLGVGCQQWRDLFVGGVRETYTGWRRRRHGGGLRGRRKGRRSERSVTLYNFLAARVQRG